jgi:chemotaxis protein MotB
MRATAIAAIAVLCSACVTKSKYEALEDKLQKTRADLTAELEQKTQEMEAQLADKNAKIADLEKKISGLQSELAQLREQEEQHQARIKELETELANLVKDRARLRASAKQLKVALQQMAKRKAEAERRVRAFRNLLAKFKTLIDAGKLKVKIAHGRMVLELPTDVLFPSGSAKLSEDGEKSIREVAAVLVTLPKRRFQVEGHTDNVPISTKRFRSNWELAAARAINVVNTMIDSGMKGGRLSAASYGKHRPVASNKRRRGRARNRRIEIVLVPDLSSLPGFEQLKKVMSKK